MKTLPPKAIKKKKVKVISDKKALSNWLQKSIILAIEAHFSMTEIASVLQIPLSMIKITKIKREKDLKRLSENYFKN